MTQIYDEMRYLMQRPDVQDKFGDGLIHRLKLSTVVDITNVFAYYTRLAMPDGSEEFEIPGIEFPHIVPPWPITFYQARTPKIYRANYAATPLLQIFPAEEVGVLVETEYAGANKLFTPEEMEQILAPTREDSEPTTIHKIAGDGYVGFPPTRWVLRISLFTRRTFRDGNMLGQIANYFVALGESGSILKQGDTPIVTGQLASHGRRLVGYYYEDNKSILRDDIDLNELCFKLVMDIPDYYILPMLLANSFAHCKNVKVQQMPPEPQRPLKNSQRRRGVQQFPHYSYHVLDIEPMKEVLRTEGQVEKTGLTRALHICRGHFATYTDEHPLFGKVTGTFWKPMHVRGSIKAGIVAKDYNVLKPKTGV